MLSDTRFKDSNHCTLYVLMEKDMTTIELRLNIINKYQLSKETKKLDSVVLLIMQRI